MEIVHPYLDDLKQLSVFLSSNTKSMSLTELHDFLCAIVSAPNLIMPNQWQPIVFGGEIEFDSMEEMQNIIGSILRLKIKLVRNYVKKIILSFYCGKIIILCRMKIAHLS